MKNLCKKFFVLAPLSLAIGGTCMAFDIARGSTHRDQNVVVTKCLVSARCEKRIHEHFGYAEDPNFFPTLDSNPDGVRLTVVLRENGQRQVYHSDWQSGYRCVGCDAQRYVEAWKSQMPFLMQECEEQAGQYRDQLDQCAATIGALELPPGQAITEKTLFKAPAESSESPVPSLAAASEARKAL